ncbi:hypothetical protein [Alteribacter aurantiacus]|uniref:hypothetical protein n=1 Tax=Alteribacter aurantiacus TaxID=254410 RepID=UPI00054DA5EB|nr:hypothetical protein [Alteribacter aurantiacus]
MKSRSGNFLIGLTVLITSIYIIFSQVFNPDIELNATGFLLFSVSIMFLCLGYLFPQYQSEDERIRMIKEKGMYFSYFAIMIFYLIFIILIGYDFINVTAFSLVQILGALTIITVFLSQVILSKVY